MTSKKKIVLVSIDSINTIGFRKVASVARSLYSNVEILFVEPQNFYTIKHAILDIGKNDKDVFKENDLKLLVKYLADKDVIGFSAMTHARDIVVTLIKEIRKVNRDVLILWGGIHPIVDPDDAISYADAICVGEGETAFSDFITKYENGVDYTDTKNFWFNIDGKIIKNGFLPLHTPEELNNMPFLLYAEDELIFKSNLGIVPLTKSDYLHFNNLSYRTIWSIGCPNRCTYCSNSKFVANDKSYVRLRYPSPSYLINEIKQAIEKHPHISIIMISDDNFMAIPLKTIEEFAVLWREKIDLPFVIGGFTPSTVNRDKIDLLLWAGLLRVRMGIQSGSEKILKLYRRPTKLAPIKKATAVLSEYSRYIVPPVYDIIVDNPIEDRSDVIDTLDVVYNIRNSFSLQIYSLRVMPGTELFNEMSKQKVETNQKDTEYLDMAPILSNVLLHLLPVIKPPRFLYDFLLRYVKPVSESQRKFPFLLIIVKIMFYSKRMISNLVNLDFSMFAGKIGFILKRFGILDYYHRVYRRRKLNRLDMIKEVSAQMDIKSPSNKNISLIHNADISGKNH